MVFENSEIINFTSSDYTSNKPTFGVDGNYSNDIKFANKNKTIDINGIDYGFIAVEVIYSGDIDYGSIYFSQPNDIEVSVGKTQDDVFVLSSNTNKLENIFLDETISGTTTFFIVVNSTNKSNLLNVSVALGKYNTVSISSIVTLNFTCIGAIYKYETGLHVYSPYDAIQSSSILKTYLYSFTELTEWSVNTVVFSTPKLDILGLPYYYGIGSSIYKVGGILDRTFGIKYSQTVSKDNLDNLTIVKNISDVGSFIGDSNTTTETCVSPTISGLGIIKEIFSINDFQKPTVYRYYLGYDSGNMKLSNDNFFVKYNLSRRSYDPITGSEHALNKIGQSVSQYYTSDWSEGEISEMINSISPDQPYIIDEICKKFTFYYTEFPYVNVGDTFYIEPELMFNIAGYYCDGVYFYNQKVPVKVTGKKVKIIKAATAVNTISSKSLSYTNTISNYDPLQYQLEYSKQADVPTTVVDYEKLIILPYCSGEPSLCPTPYLNEELTHVIDVVDKGGLVVCSAITITVPSGTTESCISQEDANTKAQELLDQAVLEVEVSEGDCVPIDTIGSLNANFTHQLKIENNPTSLTIYYNDWEWPYPSVGDTLYFDISGKFKVLDGYYYINFKPDDLIYHTTNGIIDIMYAVSNFDTTQTRTGEPIIQTNLDYTSNWYLYDVNKNTLLNEANIVKNFDPNDLYSNPQLKGGFYNSTNPSDLQIFDTFPVTSGTTYSEGECGWYQPLIPWITQEPFYYCGSKSIILDLEENCDYLVNGSLVRGFYVVSKLNGLESPTIYPVVLTVNVWADNQFPSGLFYITYTGVTTSSTESRSFFRYDEQISPTEFIYKIEIVSIEIPNPNPNPENKITYTPGVFTDCNGVCVTLGYLGVII